MLSVIRRLFDIQRAAAGADAQQRRRLRGEHAAPLLDEFGRWLDEQTLLPQSLIGRAQTYTRNQWTALRRYLADGDLRARERIAKGSL